MNLPNDVVYEILLLLPLKSLGRCKVVCKDWYTLIQSKSLIAKHMQNQRGNEKILIYHHQNQNQNYAVSICSEEEKQNDDEVDGDVFRTLIHEQHYFIKHMPLQHLKKFGDYAKVVIIGTCNGIVCFAYADWDSCDRTYNKFLTLWNPTTREFNTLPRFQLQHPPDSFESDHVGFGFDCTTDDYKVIRILNFMKREVRHPQEKYIFQMKIYSLSTNSWREFDCSGLSATKIIDSSYGYTSTLFGNKFCWLAKEIVADNIRKERFILSFDIGKEVFHKTPYPYVQFREKYHDMKLLHIHDTVALVRYVETDTEMTFEMWTTQDLEQGHSSWIKLLSVGPDTKLKMPIGFWKCRKSEDGLFVFTTYGMKGIYINNQGQVKNKRPMTINVANNSVGYCFYEKAFTFIETLVSVKKNHSLVVV